MAVPSWEITWLMAPRTRRLAAETSLEDAPDAPVPQHEPAPDDDGHVNREQRVRPERVAGSHMRGDGAPEISGEQDRPEQRRPRNEVHGDADREHEANPEYGVGGGAELGGR